MSHKHNIFKKKMVSVYYQYL